MTDAPLADRQKAGVLIAQYQKKRGMSLNHLHLASGVQPGHISLLIKGKTYKPHRNIIVSLGEWEKNPRLQAKTLVCLRYGGLSEIEPYRVRYQVPPGLDHEIPQASP
jgi:hypothetical protein